MKKGYIYDIREFRRTYFPELTQKEFAEKIGINSEKLSRIETAQNSNSNSQHSSEDLISVELLISINKAFGVSYDELLFEKQTAFFPCTYKDNMSSGVAKIKSIVDMIQNNLNGIFSTKAKEYFDTVLSMLLDIIRKPTLSIVGVDNAGKSTFINTLIKKEVLPTYYGRKHLSRIVLKHISDRPGHLSAASIWIFRDIVERKNFDIGKIYNKEYCEKYFVSCGESNTIFTYPVDSEENDVLASATAVVFTESPFLLNADLIEHSSTDLQKSDCEFSDDTVSNKKSIHFDFSSETDALIVISPSYNFLSKEEQINLKGIIKHLSVKKEFLDFSKNGAFENIFFIASKVHLVNGEFEDATKNGRTFLRRLDDSCGISVPVQNILGFSTNSNYSASDTNTITKVAEFSETMPNIIMNRKTDMLIEYLDVLSEMRVFNESLSKDLVKIANEAEYAEFKKFVFEFFLKNHAFDTGDVYRTQYKFLELARSLFIRKYDEIMSEENIIQILGGTKFSEQITKTTSALLHEHMENLIQSCCNDILINLTKEANNELYQSFTDLIYPISEQLSRFSSLPETIQNFINASLKKIQDTWNSGAEVLSYDNSEKNDKEHKTPSVLQNQVISLVSTVLFPISTAVIAAGNASVASSRDRKKLLAKKTKKNFEELAVISSYERYISKYWEQRIEYSTNLFSNLNATIKELVNTLSTYYNNESDNIEKDIQNIRDNLSLLKNIENEVELFSKSLSVR